MITGAHFLIYSKDAEADRKFFKDVLRLQAVELGGGWLIFAMPPAELGVHPGDGSFVQKHGDGAMLGTVLYLMCDDLDAQITEFAAHGVTCGTVVKADWGRSTSVKLPSGGEIGMYQPAHPTAIGNR